MFVLLNGTPGCDLPAIAAEFCKRENGAVLSVAAPNGADWEGDCARLKSEGQAVRTHGRSSFCVPCIFESVVAITQLRRALHPVDDESYAFRVICSETEFIRNAGGAAALAEYRRVCAAQDREADIGDLGVEVHSASRTAAEIGAHLQSVIREPVELSPYNPRWAQMYATHEKSLRVALGPLALEIQHIGSTAVEGLSAKPVIDIQIVVPEWPLAIKTIAPLRRLGFHFMDYPQNTTRMFFRNFPRTCHIHIVAPGQEAVDHLRFRDLLRSNTQTRNEYAELKAEHAPQQPEPPCALH